MVSFVIELKSRTVRIAGIRINADGAWTTQVVRNLLDPVDGFVRNATHLIHDRVGALRRVSPGYSPSPSVSVLC